MEIKLSLTEESRPFKHSHLGSFYMIGYGPILIQFPMVRFQTLHTIGKHIEVLHLEFR